MKAIATSDGLMKHGMALVLVLAMLSPAAALLAREASMGCCAEGADASVSAPMPCCSTTMCASPAPARQPKAIDAPGGSVVAADPMRVTADEPPPVAQADSAPDASKPAPTRVRLALIATLLI